MDILFALCSAHPKAIAPADQASGAETRTNRRTDRATELPSDRATEPESRIRLDRADQIGSGGSDWIGRIAFGVPCRSGRKGEKRR
eukprot:scaffold7465_cov239-Pinguiococcus_pyrenoidosus.AAC.2